MTPDEFRRLAEKPFARVRSELTRNPLDVLKRQRLYAALGNSMAVPAMRWIGQRIELVDGILRGAV